MPRKTLCDELAGDWEAFLAEREHKVGCPKGVGCVLQSRGPGGMSFRWLLFIAKGKSKTLNKAELEDVQRHLKRARRLNQKAYVVVGFQKPVRKVIVMPADRVLKRKRILPRKGGIPWGD